jgi:hypothetical protein
MKLTKYKTLATTASLALLLAMGTANAGNNGKGGGNSPNKGATYGESVGVSSTCELDATGTLFQVTTTVTDKTIGDTIPSYGGDMSYIDYLGKERGPHKKYLISQSAKFTGKTGIIDNELDLCAARADSSLKDGTVSLDSLIAVQVSNSKGGTSYTSQCVATDDSPKVVIDLGLLDLAC